SSFTSVTNDEAGYSLLAFALTTLVKGQSSVGPDGITTVATATCTPPMDGATATYAFVDSTGIAYRYVCGASTNGGAVTQLQAANSWVQCFNLCDSYTGCTSFTYNQGAAYGNGLGNCAIKTNNPNNFINTAPGALATNRIAAIMSRYLPYIPDFTCPAQNGQIVTDLSGVQYLLGCGNDTSGSSTGSGMQPQAPNNFNDCFSSCDAYTATTSPTACNAFVYVGASNGAGAGNCYMKFVTSASFRRLPIYVWCRSRRGVYGTIPTSSVNSWQDCFNYCDTYVDSNGQSLCSGFTYNQGAELGNGPGQCLLKSGPESFASTASLISTRIAGLNTRY
ncbi:unnamed protein product, partial [Aureobasidium mustum]